jgi:hypothetical protein
MFRNSVILWTLIMTFFSIILIQGYNNKKSMASNQGQTVILETTPTPVQIVEPVQVPQRPVTAVSQEELKKYKVYRQVIDKTAGMICDASVRHLVQKYGLNIQSLTWEDTGRFKGSSVGPNISDMTIQVQQVYPGSENYNSTCMPVIRYDNFSDKTADISPDQFYLLVGNENGQSLKAITLKEFLKDVTKYLHNPKGWKNQNTSLLAKRDSHVLVSAQACFLPVPEDGKSKFNPFLFNYQSYGNDPAVLTILATREGTSVSTGGQCIFFNQNGERAAFTGQRLSDFQEEVKEGQGDDNNMVEANGEGGLNMVLLIQVPLKQKNIQRYNTGFSCEQAVSTCDNECKSKSNVESAVIGHGELEGPYTEIANLDIERDEKFPIRVTVQYYKATSNGVVSEEDIKDIRAQIDKTYSQADYVGSLVVEGFTERPTEYTGSKEEHSGWWHYYNRKSK